MPLQLTTPPSVEPLTLAPPGSLADHLDTLAELLAGSDLEALDAHEALRSALPPETRVPLDEAMAALDFTTALTLCHDLRATLEHRP